MRPITLVAGLIGLTLLPAVTACHRRPFGNGAEAANGVIVGDTVAFHPRVIAVDRGRHRVTFQLTEPANLVLLSVVPGESIEPIGSATGTGLTSAGKHVVSAMPKAESPSEFAVWTAGQQSDYDECVRRGRGNIPKKTVVRRDSTGREYTEKTDQPEDPSREFAVERRCRDRVGKPAANPPEASERYLVLLASNAPMSFMEIVARLRDVTIYTDDMPAAMASIADALYDDRRAIWSGHYLRW